ncbi:MAG: ornithine carbamoyltransferase, partial [Pannonibacter phragmitetus]
MASPKHFLDISAVSAPDLRAILEDAKTRKQATKAGTADKPLAGKMLAMIFEKPSTRTRVSFDVGMRQLGGETLFLSGTE